MDISNILNTTSMPFNTPSYPQGPYRFIDREYFIIVYTTTPEALDKLVPEPLKPDGTNRAFFEFIRMPDSYGFGNYVESGLVIPCVYKGEPVNFTSQMYLDCLSPIVAGREIWGFPKKLGNPTLGTIHDTLVGTLYYGEQRVAMGSMQYKYKDLLSPNHIGPQETKPTMSKMTKTQVNLKIIPGVNGEAIVAQLVAYNLKDITLKGSWSGEARLDLVSHINAPVADAPVLEVLEGLHFIADLTLPYGRVLHDYLKPSGSTG